MARDNAPPIVHKELLLPPPGSKSLLASNGEPTPQLQHLSLSVLDAFGSVHDILQQTDLKHAQLARNIETLPMASSNLKCHDEDLLMLKATSQAALNSMESALNILQDLRDMNQLTAIKRYKSKSPPLSLSYNELTLKATVVKRESSLLHVFPLSLSPPLSSLYMLLLMSLLLQVL